MKNIIVTIAEILLGIILFTLIYSGGNSLTKQSQGIFEKVAEKVGVVEDQVVKLPGDPTTTGD